MPWRVKEKNMLGVVSEIWTDFYVTKFKEKSESERSYILVKQEQTMFSRGCMLVNLRRRRHLQAQARALTEFL